MKKSIIFVLVLLCGHAWGVWTVVQNPVTVSAVPGPATCIISSANCTLTLTQATTAGNTGKVFFMANGAASTQELITSIVDNLGNSYTVPVDGFGNHLGALFSTAHSIDMGYTLNLPGGATSITVTRQGNNFGTVNWNIAFVEEHHTLSNVRLTAIGTRTQSTGSTSVAGVTLTLDVSNNAVTQYICGGAGENAVTAPFNGSVVFADHFGVASASTTSNTAPTWTATTSGTAALGAVAFTEYTPAVPNHCASCDISLYRDEFSLPARKKENHEKSFLCAFNTSY